MDFVTLIPGILITWVDDETFHVLRSPGVDPEDDFSDYSEVREFLSRNPQYCLASSQEEFAGGWLDGAKIHDIYRTVHA